jgi:hypothetical protein
MISSFFKGFHIVSLLKKCGAYKLTGIQAGYLFERLFSAVFRGRSLFMSLTPGDGAAKDTFYRFLNSTRTNWMRITCLLSSALINSFLKETTDERRVNVLIVDDTLRERLYAKKAELVTWVHDHVKNINVRGFRLLTLGWSDGNSFVPVSGVLLSSVKKAPELESCRAPKRSCGYSRRLLAVTKAPEVMLKLIRGALKSGLPASYVLFDSWFSHPSTVIAVKDENIDVISMVKRAATTRYLHEGQMLPVTKIYRMHRKRGGRSKYLLSAAVELVSRDERRVPAKLVFVRKKGCPKQYLVLLSTDMKISEEEIIRIYGKRWDIEVFFKVCKSYLRLTGECRSLSYDAMTAYAAIVFARYMMLAAENRVSRDGRTFGELFYSICDELPDITWQEALRVLTEVLARTIGEKLSLTDEELTSLFEDFMSALPPTLKIKLEKGSQY